jgi:hypothetical protein
MAALTAPMRVAFVVLLVALSPVTPAVAAAADTAADTVAADPHACQPERPTVATHAYTVAPRWLELEAGIERDHFEDGTRGTGAPIVAKIGVGRRTQLEFSGSWQENDVTAASALGDATISLKWRLFDHLPVLGAFAIQPGLKLPTGSVQLGTGTGTTDGSLLLISSHDLHGVALDVNVAATERSGDGTDAPRLSTLWTVSTGYPIVAWLGAVTEIYGYPGTTGEAGEPPVVAVLLGPTATVRPWLVLDTGIIVPVSGPQPHAFYLGVTWNVGRL